MAVLLERCAGIDVLHSQTVIACVWVLDSGELRREERTFNTTPSDLYALTGWLTSHACTHVALKTKASSDPILIVLENDFEIVFIDEQAVRQQSSHTAGQSDAACLAALLASGHPSVMHTPVVIPLRYRGESDPLETFGAELEATDQPTGVLRAPTHVQESEAHAARLADLRSAVNEAQAALGELQHRAATLSRKLDEISADVQSRTMAAVLTLEGVERRIDGVAQLQTVCQGTEERLMAVKALADQVASETSALQGQLHSVRRAIIKASRARKMTRSLDIQVARVVEGMQQVAAAESAVERMTSLMEDSRHCLDSFRVGLDGLSARQTEVAAVDERVRALILAVDGVDSRMARILDRLPLIEGVEERLGRLDTLSVEVDERLNERVARGTDLDVSIGARDDPAVETLSAHEAATARSGSAVIRVRFPRAARRLIAVSASSVLIVGGLLAALWVIKPKIAGPPAVQTSAIASHAFEVPSLGNLARGHTPPRIPSRIASQGPQGPRGYTTPGKTRILVPVSIAPIYSEGDSGVSRPTPIQEELPPWPASGNRAFRTAALVSNDDFSLPAILVGLLELVIGADGHVESASLRVSIAPFDDQRVTAAARRWRYRPALKDGEPVRYKKTIKVLFR